MTIVYLHNSYAYYGGIERIFINKMNYLADVYHYKVIALTYQQCGRPIVFDPSKNIRFDDLEIPIYKEFQYHALQRIFYYHKMRKLLTKKLSEFIKDNNVSIIIGSTNEYFTMDAMYYLPRTVDTIIESHICKDYLVVQRFRNRNNPLMRLYYYFQDSQIKKFIRHSSAFVTLTEGDASAWGHLPNTFVIPNIISMMPKEDVDSERIYKRVITLGRLDIQKGYDLLLKTWKIVNCKHPDWHLDIYGDGDEKDNLTRLCDLFNLKQSVSIHGFISDINEELQKSDLFVMSSRYEGFGLVLVEAMSNGIPCVSFDCPYGPSDVIKDGEDGMLVENGNTKELADKICWMIENNKQRTQMGQMARENVKRFLPEKIMPQWKQLFDTLFTRTD